MRSDRQTAGCGFCVRLTRGGSARRPTEEEAHANAYARRIDGFRPAGFDLVFHSCVTDVERQISAHVVGLQEQAGSISKLDAVVQHFAAGFQDIPQVHRRSSAESESQRCAIEEQPLHRYAEPVRILIRRGWDGSPFHAGVELSIERVGADARQLGDTAARQEQASSGGDVRRAAIFVGEGDDLIAAMFQAEPQHTVQPILCLCRRRKKGNDRRCDRESDEVDAADAHVGDGSVGEGLRGAQNNKMSDRGAAKPRKRRSR